MYEAEKEKIRLLMGGRGATAYAVAQMLGCSIAEAMPILRDLEQEKRVRALPAGWEWVQCKGAAVAAKERV